MIRDATSADIAGIDELLRVSFGGGAEVGIADRLRARKLVLAELVAEEEDAGGMVGHVMFSRLDVTIDRRQVPAAALAPLAVYPSFQRQGIGSALVRAGLQRMLDLGIKVVIVLGHPRYYPRFGFSAALARKLAHPFAGHGDPDAFMALEPVAGTLAGQQGVVAYDAVAFNIVEAA